MRTFKAATAKRINNLRNTPGGPVWQRNYYERVIRDERELERARKYILDNPHRWAEDPNNPANRGSESILRQHRLDALGLLPGQ